MNRVFIFNQGLLFASLLSLSACSQLTPRPDQTDTDTHSSSESQTTEARKASLQEIAYLKLPVRDPVVTHSSESIRIEQAIQKYEWEQSKEDDTFEQLIFAPATQPPEDLWEALSGHFFMAPAHRHHYSSYLKYYLKRPKYLKRVSVRAKPYLHFIFEEVKKRHLPYEIALLPVVESGFYPFARSYVSASGLWQFMPATGHYYGLHKNWWYNGSQDVVKSTEAALTYLQKLYRMNDYDWLLALASYNAGYGNVLKAQKQYLKKHPDGDPNFWNIRHYLPKETRHYVPQLLAIAYLIDHRQQYGLQIEPIENKPFFASTPLNRQINLVAVAEKTDTDLKLIELLNPGFLRKATPPEGQYELLLPVDKATQFVQTYAEKPKAYEIHWAQHTIQNGESLSVIASRYGTSVKQIKSLNGMNSSRIRAGKTLLIPIPENYVDQLLAKREKTRHYNGRKHFHTVQNGESLWSIAKYYNVSTRKLCEWNRISIREPISVGKKLEIRSAKYGKKLSHTLRSGESLWTIAQKYSVSTADLCHWNGIRKSQVLHPGTKIDVWIKG